MKRLEAAKKLEEKQSAHPVNTATAPAAAQAATTTANKTTVLPPRLDKVTAPPPAGNVKQHGRDDSSGRTRLLDTALSDITNSGASGKGGRSSSAPRNRGGAGSEERMPQVSTSGRKHSPTKVSSLNAYAWIPMPATPAYLNTNVPHIMHKATGLDDQYHHLCSNSLLSQNLKSSRLRQCHQRMQLCRCYLTLCNQQMS